MENMKFVVGLTKDKEVAFAEIRIRDDNMFSASFDTVMPTNAEHFMLYDAEDYVSDMYTRECFGDKEFLDLLEYYDCSPSELPIRVLRDADIMDILDCSLYPEIYTVNDMDFVFESSACGQHDLTDELSDYVNEMSVKNLIEFWKNHHLSTLTSEELIKLNIIIDNLREVDEEEYIKNIIKDYFV